MRATTGLIYLASPYTHDDDDVVEQRVHDVCKAAASLMAGGHLVLSPIAHSHAIAKVGSLPTDFEWWQRVDKAIIDVCDELWVLQLDGWEESRGIKGEVEYAESIRKPVFYIDKSGKHIV